MEDLIRNIIREETDSVSTKTINLIKDFIIDFFSGNNDFEDVKIEIGSFSLYDGGRVPDILITVYFSEYYTSRGYDDSDLLDEMDFLFDMLFPKDDEGRLTGVYSLSIKSLYYKS